MISVFIEKGVGLVLPGFVPDPLGEVYLYFPSLTEIQIWFGVGGFGALMFTVMTKIALPLLKDHEKEEEEKEKNEEEEKKQWLLPRAF